MPTRQELEEQITAARRELCDCEDTGDALGAELARCRCDQLLDRWAHTTPTMRVYPNDQASG